MGAVFIEVELKFIKEVTPQLEDAIFDSFELSDVQCGAILTSKDGIVSLSIYSDKLSEKDAINIVKIKLSEIMFNFKTSDYR